MSPSRSPRSRPIWRLPGSVHRYGVAILAVGAALLLMLAVRELTGEEDPRPALLVAIAVSALFGGWGPGGLAVAVGTIVTRDPVMLIAGGLLAAVCAASRRSASERAKATTPGATEEPVSTQDALPAPSPGRFAHERGHSASAPLLELTTEATWRFHHEQPLDITLPEDEQIEHLYLYSVLAECNDAFARMYGFRSASDVVGTRLVVFLPPSDPENLAYLRAYIRSGYRLEDAESHEIDRYGRAKHFVNNLVGIFERGQLVGSWGTQRDVTQQKLAGGAQEYSSRLHSTKSSSQ